MENDDTPLHDNSQEKSHLRVGILRLLDEPSKLVAAQLALLISKIMRCDFPHQWPELQPTLVQLLEKGSELQQSRALLALCYILKEMVTMVLPSQRRVFHDFSSSMLQGCAAMWGYYTTDFTNWFERWAQAPQPGALAAGEHKAYWGVLTTKVMQRLVVDGSSALDRNPTGLTFLTQCCEGLARLLDCYLRAHPTVVGQQAGPEAHQLMECVSRVMKRLLKVLITAHQAHTDAFVAQPFFLPLLNFVLHAIQALRDAVHRTVLFLPLRLMLEFLQHCLSHRDGAERYQREFDAALMENGAEPLRQLVSTLILDYLAVTPSEMQEWDASPEEYMYESEEMESSGADLYTVRQNVQNVLLALLEQYNEPVCQIMGELHQQVTVDGPSSMDRVLRWDCLYQALGLGCYSLPKHLDFSTVLAPHVVANLQNPDMHRILRRRAAWLLGQWAASIPEPRLPYHVLLLDVTQECSGADVVVRLTALKALFWLIDDLLFDATTFSPLLPRLMDQLFFFLQHSRCIDVRLSLVSLIILLMEKMDTLLSQFVEKVVEVFCGLWGTLHAAGDADSTETRLKSSLIIALTSLVKCLRDASERVHELVIPMILYSTNLHHKDAMFLLEAGLELWKATLQYAVNPSPHLLHCFENIPAVVQESEELEHSLSILDSYILLGKGLFVQRYAPQLTAILVQLLQETKDTGQVLCTNILDTVVDVSPEDGPPSLHGVFTKVMQYLLTGREGDLVMANYLCALLHVLLANRTWFLGFVGDHLAAFLDKWIDLHDCLPSTYQRKLSCLALLSLLPVPPTDAVVLPRLASILHTALEGIATESRVWSVDYGPHNNDDVPDGCAEAARRQELLERDAVLNVSVKQVMGQKLQELYAQSGPAVTQIILMDAGLMQSINAHFLEGAADA
eukprot:GGOE01014639.1.p1 GENE.GGOE01014639.1~~GGOE01014639.1.p1  ORF type:complete len:1018 (+),score=329.31 GGOE01014639.1:341-3055(+)